MELTKRQAQIYHLLKHRWVQEGRQPGLSELATELGIHYVSLKQHLQLIAAKGYLTFEAKGKGRSPIITLTEPEHLLPLLGEIAAGSLHDAEQTVEGYLNLPAKDRFALSVRGNSMAGQLLDGDVVILKRAAWRDGDICAAYVDGQTTLKYVRRQRGSVLLIPHNGDYPTLTVPAAEVHIQGVCCGALRGELIPVLLKEGTYVS